MEENTGTYDPRYSPTGSGVESSTENLKAKVVDAAGTVKDKASHLGRQAADQIDANRSTAAAKLESAAALVHEKADILPGGRSVKNAAHSAAQKLESTAGYIRLHDSRSMLADVGDLVRYHPGPSLLVAAGLGFLIGRAFRDR